MSWECSSTRSDEVKESNQLALNRLKLGKISLATEERKNLGECVGSSNETKISENLPTPTLFSNLCKEFSRKDIKRKITIPNKLTTDLAEDIGVQIGDGSIQSKFNKRGTRYYIIYFCGNITEDVPYLRYFIIPLKKRLFNLNLKLFSHKKAGTCYIKTESKALFSFYTKIIGLPFGKKIRIKIPEIILNSNKEIKAACIRGIGDTDFSLTFKNKSKNKDKPHTYPVLKFVNSSDILVKQIREILKEFGIASCIKLNYKVFLKKTKKLYNLSYLFINGEKNLEKWMKFIGFNNPVYITKYLIWKQYGFCPPYTNLKERIEILEGFLEPKQE